MPGSFEDQFGGTTVFVTGHTGFKGSWLCLWLTRLGARVVGYSDGYPSDPNHFQLLELPMTSLSGDVRDATALTRALSETRPEVVYHLAAQSLVRRSYEAPLDTFSTNVVGTATLLEACRRAPTLKAVVVVTSDKCYAGASEVARTEADPVGGDDPYSASKACAELVSASYRSAFFRDVGRSPVPLLSTARAGNVIGGGDWAEDRLVPDIARATSSRVPVRIRNPRARRPWQHVLDALHGYLLLGAGLLRGRAELSGAWNFGPGPGGHHDVLGLVAALRTHWPEVSVELVENPRDRPEQAALFLDSTKARRLLGWQPVWEGAPTVRHTADWYRRYYETGRSSSVEQLEAYTRDLAALKTAATR